MVNAISNAAFVDDRIFRRDEKEPYLESGSTRCDQVVDVRRVRHHGFKAVILPAVDRRSPSFAHHLLRRSCDHLRIARHRGRNIVSVEINSKWNAQPFEFTRQC